MKFVHGTRRDIAGHEYNAQRTQNLRRAYVAIRSIDTLDSVEDSCLHAGGTGALIKSLSLHSDMNEDTQRTCGAAELVTRSQKFPASQYHPGRRGAGEYNDRDARQDNSTFEAQGYQPTSADWARIKPVFETMYIDDDLTLDDVMVELRVKYGFRATKQMCKRRIRQWKLRKNLSVYEVEAILGIQALRQAAGKDTLFTLRGRPVAMRTGYRFQRHRKLHTKQAIDNYASGRTPAWPELRPVTPVQFDDAIWSTSNKQFEAALHAFGSFFSGLLDARYYRLENHEFVMKPSILRDEVSDICSSLVEGKIVGMSSITMPIRKLALLVELIVLSPDAWIHCRYFYMMWVLFNAGYREVVKTLLTHTNRLLIATADSSCAQWRFVQYYSSMDTSQLPKLAADIISLKADLALTVRTDNLAAFRIRTVEYDVCWRRNEQKVQLDLVQTKDFLGRCVDVLGLLCVESLTIVRILLSHRTAALELVPELELGGYLDILLDTKRLTISADPRSFLFDGQHLNMEAASELAQVYCLCGLHEAEAWIFRRLIVDHMQTQSGLRREYSLLIHISKCPVLQHSDAGTAWSSRKREIEKGWQAQVEAAAPTSELLQSCDAC